MAPTIVGQPVPRIDVLEKVTGDAVYSVDIQLPNMLYGTTARSPHPHARITHIDTSGAKTTPGVVAVVTGKDMPYRFGPMIKDQPFLAVEKTRYVGEPVAAVAAESAAIAHAAASKIVVTYETLRTVFDLREAVSETAPRIHESLQSYDRNKKFDIVPGTNICTDRTLTVGNLATGFAMADDIFEDEFCIHPVAHAPLETHAAVCRYNPVSGQYTFWSATDAPHRRASEVAKALGVPLNKVRFISAYQGGGFGGKGTLVAEAVALCLAKYSGGRPVKVVFSREEELTATQTRVGAILRLKTGVKRDGTLTARQADILWDSGAYASKAPEVSYRGATTIFGPYRIPHIEMISRLVYTNNQITGAYRGFGTTQVTWACESQIDIIAHALGLDPLSFRQKNAYKEGDRFINGQVLKGVGLSETLERASMEIGWHAPKQNGGGSRVRGRGLATMIKGTNTPTDSYCFIKIDPDGSCTVLSSTVELGAGQKTMMAQIAAETIGLPLAWVSVPQPDTEMTPYDFGVTSSRSTFHMGNAVRLAAEKARARVLDIAAEVLDSNTDSLRIFHGQVVDTGGRQAATLSEVMAKKFGPKGGSVLAEGHYSPDGSPLLAAPGGQEAMSSIFWMFVTHAVEIEVDTETGVVRVIKVAAAHDVGRAINPVGCEQQIEGAVVMGLSNTLFEEFKMANGRIVNDSFADYKLATTMDLPEIVPILIESQHTEGPYGAKGVAEPAVAPVAPAVANAIFDAVGLRIKSLPITPEKILMMLK